jgi:hypothetical protein
MHHIGGAVLVPLGCVRSHLSLLLGVWAGRVWLVRGYYRSMVAICVQSRPWLLQGYRVRSDMILFQQHICILCGRAAE